jgi:hypothetical protein
MFDEAVVNKHIKIDRADSRETAVDRVNCRQN